MTYYLVETLTFERATTSVAILDGPYSTIEEAHAGFEAYATNYYADAEDVFVQDWHLIIDDGQNGLRTVLIAQQEDAVSSGLPNSPIEL